MSATTSTQSGSVPAKLAPHELRAWRGLLRAHAALTKALDAQLEATHGLPLSSYEVLLHLNESSGEAMRMCDLATSVILSRSGLTRLIDRLEREGLVARQSCPQDARGSYAVLTERGRERLRAARATHLAGVRALFLERFSASELEQLGDFWDRIVGPSDGACGC